MFDGFPKELSQDVSIVLKLMSKKTYHNVQGISEQTCTYQLLNGQIVTFPYRIYFIDEFDSLSSSMTYTQQMIYHCLLTRSCDGYVREKHIEAILRIDYPHWAIPYILKVSDEYVIEIVEKVYSQLKNRDTQDIKEFCQLNRQAFLRSHDRMISYWNEFYRDICFRYRNYVGRQLFEECFGYTRSIEKSRRSLL